VGHRAGPVVAAVTGESRQHLPDPTFWRGRRVLLTGHTGFKGSWLAYWLDALGAQVIGLALPELPTTPSLWKQLGLDRVHDLRGEITSELWQQAAAEFAPEVVFHLAAQSLVVVGYSDPYRTFRSNVQGTADVIRFACETPSVIAAVVITTDKVYDPRQSTPFSEQSFLGGLDPYAASKAAAELVVGAWPSTDTRLGTARAGNVIGGGDWSRDRLLPDLVRAWSADKQLVLRNPAGVRPWQHVLEPLRGYLVFAESLATNRQVSRSYNFGPTEVNAASVQEIVTFAAKVWTELGGSLPESPWTATSEPTYHEVAALTLDSTLAMRDLGWSGVLGWQEAVELTLTWYMGIQSGRSASELLGEQLEEYGLQVEGRGREQP
jgi:CDP-glucose 4,6-dehydratase